MISSVVDVAWLKVHPEAVLADVRYYLDGRSAAEAYAAGHIAGAVRIDMDEVLAEPASPEAGRHPLPSPEKFAAGLSAAGIGDESVVVAYDDAGGAMAGRLVWLLRMLGHEAALLDGGLAAWEGDLTRDVPTPEPAVFAPRPWPTEALASIDDAATGSFVIDARGPERYRGETEPLDPRAGHIPGARNAPFTGNLDPLGRFLTPDELRARFVEVTDASEVISYCGSGITACHNLIALEYAGLGKGRLYPGSWSQYSNTDRPAATHDPDAP